MISDKASPSLLSKRISLEKFQIDIQRPEQNMGQLTPQRQEPKTPRQLVRNVAKVRSRHSIFSGEGLHAPIA
jgi:hypothetical protein